jgi:sugar phosphate isomerase/epimerase
MAKPRVGVQLIVFGERSRQDLPGVLKAVAKGGYDGFECGTPADEQQADEIKAAMAATRLACTGTHTSFGGLEDDAVVRGRIALTKALGAPFLISSGPGWKTLEDAQAAGRIASDVGRKCQEAGIRFLYHNHHHEFRSVGPAAGMHAFIAASDPKLVGLCPDVYWVHVGGEKPAEFISRYKDRCPCFHFKDGLGGDQYREFRELGQGKVDLPAALKAALACDPDWIVVEQDHTSLDPADSVRISREYLKSLGL